MYDKQYHQVDLSKHRFLITGGAGFIGSNLVQYLLKYKAAKVRILDNFSTGFRHNIEPFKDNPSFELIEGDIRHIDVCRQALSGIDYVSHQAALGSVPRSIHDPIATNAVNISGFLNMICAVKDHPDVKRFVYAASSSTYGDSRELPKTEERIGKPLSPYAVTKYVNELYADVFSSVYGLQTIGLRYFNVFGPGQSPEGEYAAVIPLFLKAITENQSAAINGDGKQTRDFTFIENAVQANIRAFFADSPEAINQIYNVAVGERTSLNQLWQLINDIAGKDIAPTYKQPRAGDIRDSLANIEKAKDLLKYSELIGIREGMQITFDHFTI